MAILATRGGRQKRRARWRAAIPCARENLICKSRQQAGLQQPPRSFGKVANGARNAALESLPLAHFHTFPASQVTPLDQQALQNILAGQAPQILHRDLEHRGYLAGGACYSSRLLGVLLIV